MKTTKPKTRIPSSSLNSDELGLTQHSRGIFARHTDKKGRVQFQIQEGRVKEALIIPAPVARLFNDILHQFAEGNMVSVTTEQRELTTQQAADHLNVSRPYLVGLLEEGKIPFRKVGTHRRIYAKDVIAYKKREDAKRNHSMNELVRQAQELNMGY